MTDDIKDDSNITSDLSSNLHEGQAPIENGTPKRQVSAIVLLGEILLTGTAGWKQLRRARFTPEKAASGCLYPIIALGAACKFAGWFYQPEFNISATLIEAVTFFAAFFFAYFAVPVVCKCLFPSEAKQKTDTAYFKLVVQYSLASLALFCIPAEVLPILNPIAVFLPIWTVFIITKAVRFLRFSPSCQNRCLVTLALTTILLPYLFIWIGTQIF